MGEGGAGRKIDHLVMDASVALKWLLPAEQGEAQAIQILQGLCDKKLTLSAPTLLIYELLNGLLMAVRRGRATSDIVLPASQQFLKLPILYDTSIKSGDSTLALAIRTGLSVYDSAYLELASRIQRPLVTSDRDLFIKGRKFGCPVIWIEDLRLC
ncbi:MAG: type II toxin-antitoxin system VapC family toxin [Armatimonadetes bacterium]|nr:type II toxin-antitoxin system VapC family toxin [Armatimonadota bacterium]